MIQLILSVFFNNLSIFPRFMSKVYKDRAIWSISSLCHAGMRAPSRITQLLTCEWVLVVVWLPLIEENPGNERQEKLQSESVCGLVESGLELLSSPSMSMWQQTSRQSCGEENSVHVMLWKLKTVFIVLYHTRSNRQGAFLSSPLSSQLLWIQAVITGVIL